MAVVIVIAVVLMWPLQAVHRTQNSALPTEDMARWFHLHEIS